MSKSVLLWHECQRARGARVHDTHRPNGAGDDDDDVDGDTATAMAATAATAAAQLAHYTICRIKSPRRATRRGRRAALVVCSFVCILLRSLRLAIQLDHDSSSIYLYKPITRNLERLSSTSNTLRLAPLRRRAMKTRRQATQRRRASIRKCVRVDRHIYLARSEI